MAEQQGKKKIFIDEDWKSQVEAEREAARQQKQPSSEASDPSSEASDTVERAKPADPTAGQMPPATFQMLVTTLATEAMVGLGQIPLPGLSEPTVNLAQAKYFIDTLEVLEEKTRGNLTTEESQSLTDLLYQLRLAYVAVRDRGPGSA
ncbi:MAG: DUF1844 domain-containing protein [Pirellulales bacterium]